MTQRAAASELSTWFGLLCVTAVLLGSTQPAAAQLESKFEDEFDKTETGHAPDRTTTESKALAANPAARDEQEALEPFPHESRDAQLSRAQNSWFGPTGGLHVVDAGSGPNGTLRLQLGVDFFSSRGFLVEHDTDHYSGGTLALSWTPSDQLELFGSVANRANFNDKEQPRLMQVLGDTLLGIKAFAAVLPWLTLGTDVRLVVLNTVGDVGPAFRALSFGLRGNASADLRALPQPVPLIARLSVDYFFDNSADLIGRLERERYDALGPDRRPFANEDRNLLRRVERFALGINRTDALDIGLGFEVPLRVDTDWFIHPILEWTLAIPVNRQGYSCLLTATNAGGGAADSCLKAEGFLAMPSTLSIGARVFSSVPGLSFAVGFDLGLGGTSSFVRELAANKPYDVLLAVSYAIDARAQKKPRVRTVEVVREIARPQPQMARVDGRVVDSGTGGPVANAVIRYPDRELSAQQADEQGRFVSYELPAGEARFEIGHPDYESRICVVQIPTPRALPPPAALPPPSTTQASPPISPLSPAHAILVSLRCELTQKPRAGSMRGLVLNETGKPVAGARVELGGPSSASLVTDAQGQFAVVTLVAGNYTVRVEAEGYLLRLVPVEVKPTETTSSEIVLVPKPKLAQVELTKQEVRIRKQIFFQLNSAQISRRSHGLLSEIADVLLRNPQVKLVEIQGHTDNKGAPELNQQLSQQRADAVRSWLIEAGIDQTRVLAKGYGDTRPLEPNLTERHRARNRRVQFIIKEQD